MFTPLALGAFGKTAGNLINSNSGRPVRFIRGGIGATTLAQWSSSNSPQRAALVAAIKKAGGADAILVQVGRNDAANLIVSTIEGQATALRFLISALRTEAAVPSAMVFIGSSQDLIGGTTEQHLQLARQRLAEVSVVASVPNVRYGFSTYDLPTSDNIHQTESSQIISGTRFGAQVLAWLKNQPEQRGPIISRITLVDQNRSDIELQLSVGTDITPGSGIDGFQIVATDNLAELNIVSAERLGPTTVRLTHEARGNRQVRFGYALDHDVSDTNCLRSNSINQLPAEPYVSNPL
ncbi:sialate O-acetylesterase [Sphingomonas palmae]|uniref:sialate O-acetylesterase n=1 Tax=Sphingomonas palmae TaxID=1855283 RepID=UPI0015A60E5E|nr:sialate O-acetylesterase [Sphingomonas palmae]